MADFELQYGDDASKSAALDVSGASDKSAGSALSPSAKLPRSGASSSASTNVVTRELAQWGHDPPIDLFVAPYEDESGNQHLHLLHGMVLGPVRGPYFLGFHRFSIRVPVQYPHIAPKVEIISTNRDQTRFNPNLYATGKVCLSILGTWRGEPGEQWSAAHSMQSILRSIQSLMHDTPYQNEPGYADTKDKAVLEPYNDKILHETIRISVIMTMEAILGLSAMPARDLESYHSKPFDYICKALFLYHYDQYLAVAERELSKHADGKEFKRVQFESGGNGMAGVFQYSSLVTRLKAIKKKLDEETEAWAAVDKSIMDTPCLAADELEIDAENFKRNPVPGADASPTGGTPFVWEASIFSENGRQYEGGCFSLKIIYGPQYPLEPPRVFFQSKLFHPLVTASDGLARLPLTMPSKWRPSITNVLKAVQNMMKEAPSPDPMLHLNQDAAALLFSGKDEDIKTYNRRVRRNVEDSIA